MPRSQFRMTAAVSAKVFAAVRRKASRTFKGFTLVELIVVITILAILALIGFLALSWYTTDANKSAVVSNLRTVEKGLSVGATVSGKLPMPTNPFNVTYSGGVAWRQGTAGKDVMAAIGMGEPPKDPRGNSEFDYSLSANGMEYQVASAFVASAFENRAFVDEASAETFDQGAAKSLPTAAVGGNYNGLFVPVNTGSTNYLVASPSIILSDLTVRELTPVPHPYVVESFPGVPASWSWKVSWLSQTGLSFVPKAAYSGTTAFPTTQTGVADLVTNLTSAYTGTSAAAVPKIAALLSQPAQAPTAVTVAAQNSLGREMAPATASSDPSTPQAPTAPPAYDPAVLEFLGYDANLDGVFKAGSQYVQNWVSNGCDSSSIPVFRVINPASFFSTERTLTGSTVYKVSNGTYSITGNTGGDGFVKLGSCSAVIGQSKAGTVFNSNFSGGSTSATGAIFAVLDKQNAVIASLTVNPNKAATYKYKEGIGFSGTTNSTVKDVLVSWAERQGVALRYGSSNNVLDGIEAINGGNNGIVLFMNANSNRMSNLKTSFNVNGLVIQTNLNSNVVQGVEAQGNSSAGIVVQNAANSNVLSNLRLANNTNYGLLIYSWANDNVVSDVLANRSVNPVNVQSWSLRNSLSNFEIYNGTNGLLVYDRAHQNSFNNFHTYQTTGGGVIVNNSTNNSFNNFLSYNHGHISVEVSTNSAYNYFNNLHTFNNTVAVAGDALSFRFYSSSNYGHLKDYRAYNNAWYGCIEVGSTGTTKSGIYKIFGIANFSSTNCAGTTASNDGTTMDCNWHTRPSWLTNVSGTCAAGYSSTLASSYSLTRSAFTYGSNIANQVRPMKWDAGSNAFVAYGTDGTDYNSSKKIGDW